jgi:hypothetical protein
MNVSPLILHVREYVSRSAPINVLIKCYVRVNANHLILLAMVTVQMAIFLTANEDVRSLTIRNINLMVPEFGCLSHYPALNGYVDKIVTMEMFNAMVTVYIKV